MPVSCVMVCVWRVLLGKYTFGVHKVKNGWATRLSYGKRRHADKHSDDDKDVEGRKNGFVMTSSSTQGVCRVCCAVPCRRTQDRTTDINKICPIGVMRDDLCRLFTRLRALPVNDLLISIWRGCCLPPKWSGKGAIVETRGLNLDYCEWIFKIK